MRVQTDAVVPTSTVMDSEFDLDIRIVESGSVVAELTRITDDNCGATCESACVSCP